MTRFKRRNGPGGAHLGDCSPPGPECKNPGIGKPMSLNAFEDITDRYEPASEPKCRSKRRIDEVSRIGSVKLIRIICAIDSILTDIDDLAL